MQLHDVREVGKRVGKCCGEKAGKGGKWEEVQKGKLRQRKGEKGGNGRVSRGTGGQAAVEKGGKGGKREGKQRYRRASCGGERGKSGETGGDVGAQAEVQEGKLVCSLIMSERWANKQRCGEVG
eukprot:354423-Chlamydomonas_euryale.AAC.7